MIQDARGADVIAVRPIMNATLTYDHRLVDGALAGRFLRDLREKLETWPEDAMAELRPQPPSTRPGSSPRRRTARPRLRASA